jgi:hypothetical protein
MNQSLVIGAAFVLCSCASTAPPVQSMQDPQANFSAFTTFSWQNSGHAPGEPPISILDSNIRTAIAGELQRKGYAEAVAGQNSDLVLHYETAAAEKLKSNPIRIGFGVGGAGSNGAAGVGVSSPSAKNVREGMLVLRAIDPQRNAEVWNGRVSRELGKGGPPDPALIQGAVGELLESFPSRAP